MARIVESDTTVFTKTTYMATNLFNQPSTFLRLYQNNLTPTPSNVQGDFNEATFDTYSARALQNQWSSPARVQFGEWHFFSPIFTYNPPTTTNNTIYGAYVTNPSGLLFSVRFDAPIQMQIGGLPFSLQLEIIDWAASLLGAP